MARTVPLLLVVLLVARGSRAPEIVLIRDPPSPAAGVGESARAAVFAIDREEVSLGDFQAFAASGYAQPELWSAEGQRWLAGHPGGAGPAARAAGRGLDHPVVAVTWFEAEAFCRWRDGRLPTGAEWERAACGAQPAAYPWGTGEPADISWFGEGKYGMVEGVATAPVHAQDQALASPDGLLHTAGNVWEWTADSFSTAPESPWKTLRGGSYANLPSYCTCAHREPARPDEPRLTVGFRCAYDR